MIVESSPFPWFSCTRRRTRRIVVAVYWVIVLSIFGLYQWVVSLHPSGFYGLALLFPLQLIVFLPAILGGVRAGGIVKPFGKVRLLPMDDTFTRLNPNQPLMGNISAAEMTLDERDEWDRDRVHYFAYTASRWLVLALAVVQVVAGLAGPQWLLRIGAASFILIALVLWSLPQSIILWTEPDMEEPQ